MRDPRHNILFEPIKLGPVTAKNRFYQVPHCTGMGWRRPKALAALRGMKAQGGWGVVNTEYCSIHPSSDNDAYPFCTLWTDDDIAAHHLMTKAVHAHGALAGVELWIGGAMVVNLGTRLPPLGLRNSPQKDVTVTHPGQTRRLDKQDIRNIRQWHKMAAKRALEAEFDIVYVYATHGYLLSEFLNPYTNTRSDEYGGSLENRVRFIAELIEDTKEIVQGKAAVATRFSVGLDDPESYDAFGLLAHLPDLWDLTVPDYAIEMGHSRFVKEAALNSSVAQAKALTDRPVVAVGRFTSPEKMVQVIKNGSQDMIGAARPSIADPFLPYKIDIGALEDIRECIGCNICYAHDSLGVPIRCTQNPSMGEEWRRGWHPEIVQAAAQVSKVLVVGSGPAGLEAARVLGQSGHQVFLAEARRALGGRINEECSLPGLSEWARVRDWRLTQIAKLDNVQVFLESHMTAADVLELGIDHVLIATGAKWAKDAIGRHSNKGFSKTDQNMIMTPEEFQAHHNRAASKVLIYDDDHHYYGSVLALDLKQKGHDVVLVTPAGRACSWGVYTDEQAASNAALIGAGVIIITNHKVDKVCNGQAQLTCVFSGQNQLVNCDYVIPLTRKLPVAELYDALMAQSENWASVGLKTVEKVGDANAPSLIAAAVYSGYRAAIELGQTLDDAQIYGKKELPGLN